MPIAPERPPRVRRARRSEKFQQRVRLLAAVGVLATLTVATVAFVTLQRSRMLTQRVARVSAAQHLFLSDQQVREEIVGRVTESLYLTTTAPGADAVVAPEELRTMAGEMSANNQELAELDLPDGLAGPTRAVINELDQLVFRADAQLDEIYGGQRPEAEADLPGFLAYDDSIDAEAIAVPFDAEVDRLNAQASTAQRQAVLVVGVVAAFALALQVLSSRWVVGRIRRALRHMSLAATRLAAGDLTAVVDHDTDDELGASFNTLASTLAGMFERVEADAARESFNSQLVEALEMADAEGEVFETVGRAMARVGQLPVELLLSDSSHAHLERAAGHPTAGAPGCTVGSPFQCIAVRRGSPVVFASSTELNTCPKLRDRPAGDLSAVCVPVSFMGRAMGVLHATGPDHEPPTPEVVDQLAQLAALSGARIGTVRAFQQSQLQAATDALTGLANRRTVEQQVRELFGAGRLFSFVMADLDFFKRLNDSHGHEMGDRALRLFATVFADSLRAGDTAARWGGEEFAAILPGIRAGETAQVLERLRTRLAAAILTGETPVFTASFGVIDSATVGNLELLLRSADDALYAAKEAGRDRVVIGDPVLLTVNSRLRPVEHEARIDPSGLTPAP